MSTIKMSSDEARSKWREVLDTAVAGNKVVIERYGKPVAVIVPYAEYVQSAGQANTVQEETAVYQTDDWETKKAGLIAELKGELLAELQLQGPLLQSDPAGKEPRKAAYFYTPRLAHPEQAEDFKKEIIAELPDAEI